MGCLALSKLQRDLALEQDQSNPNNFLGRKNATEYAQAHIQQGCCHAAELLDLAARFSEGDQVVTP